MPSSLEGYFELMALCTEPADRGGAQISVSDFNEMMPWHLETLLEFKVSHRENVMQRSRPDNTVGE